MVSARWNAALKAFCHHCRPTACTRLSDIHVMWSIRSGRCLVHIKYWNDSPQNYVVHSTIRLSSLAAQTTNYYGPEWLLVDIFKCQRVVHFTCQVKTTNQQMSPRQDTQRHYLVAVLSTALTKTEFFPTANLRTKIPYSNLLWTQVLSYIQWSWSSSYNTRS